MADEGRAMIARRMLLAGTALPAFAQERVAYERATVARLGLTID